MAAALLFFTGRVSAMTQPSGEASLLSEVEAALQKKFQSEGGNKQRLPSTARAAAPGERIDALVLPDEMRSKMPYTKDKYLVRENPQEVQWEREVRKFLRNLTPRHGHRVSAVMIYEWATGIKVSEIMKDEKKKYPGQPNWRSDIRKINKILKFYFGKSYMTYIMGRKVPNCYRVREGYYIKRHRPMTLTLYAEYAAGTLHP